MLNKYLKLLLLCNALIGCATPNGAGQSSDCGFWSGLCTPAPANTTAAVAPVMIPPVIVIQPEGPDAGETGAETSDSSGGSGTAVAAVPPMMAAGPTPLRIALLLPLRSGTLGQAAAAVRDGFMAAYEREKDGVTVSVLETGDNAPEVLDQYTAALPGNDVIVGPLTHSGVSAVALSGAVNKPTIALNQPDPQAGADLALPSNMLDIGLSLVREARQVADWASAGKVISSAFIISTDSPWQRRAAGAFAEQWQSRGLTSQSIELDAVGSHLDSASLAQLLARLRDEQPAVLLVALDAEQTRQLRLAAGKKITVYGTSQLNPLVLVDWATAIPVAELDRVRFVDLPWQLQPDNPAVMAYPPKPVAPGEKRSADLERLYALGIDAYRVALKVGRKETHFDIDGVTGKLAVDFGSGPARFERTEPKATYRDGVVVPMTDE
jgi:uncharacterized protein